MNEKLDWTEDSRISLKAASWKQVIILIGVICSCSIALWAKLDTTSQKAEQAIVQSQENSRQIMQMSQDLHDMSTNIRYFREKYDQDMNRYIREYPSK